MHNAPTSQDGFDEWEIRGITAVVNRFMRTRNLPVHLEDDLLQEALIQWHLKRGAFDPTAGASQKTFLDRVVGRRLISIEREWNAEKRGGKERPLSLDRAVAPNGEVTLGELLPDPSPSGPEMGLDLGRALKLLTPRQRKVAAGYLAGKQVKGIAAQLGISRDTVNEDRKAILRIFEDQGLAEYFR